MEDNRFLYRFRKWIVINLIMGVLFIAIAINLKPINLSILVLGGVHIGYGIISFLDYFLMKSYEEICQGYRRLLNIVLEKDGRTKHTTKKKKA